MVREREEKEKVSLVCGILNCPLLDSSTQGTRHLVM